MNDPKKALIRWKQLNTASQRGALQESLAHVFAKRLNHSSVSRVGELTPLKVAICMFEHCVQLVADESSGGKILVDLGLA